MGIRHIIVAAVGLALGACVTAPPPRPEPPASVETPAPAPQVRCPNCGRVERIEVRQVQVQAQAQAQARNTGAVLGGVVGGVVSGTSSSAATAKPAMRQSYRISVRMDDGRHLVFIQGAISPNLREGSNVRIENGRVILFR
jgi:outer membrane lipoprotein SlyB